jgi:hypothetical protein
MRQLLSRIGFILLAVLGAYPAFAQKDIYSGLPNAWLPRFHRGRYGQRTFTWLLRGLGYRPCKRCVRATHLRPTGR